MTAAEKRPWWLIVGFLGFVVGVVMLGSRC